MDGAHVHGQGAIVRDSTPSELFHAHLHSPHVRVPDVGDASAQAVQGDEQDVLHPSSQV